MDKTDAYVLHAFAAEAETAGMRALEDVDDVPLGASAVETRVPVLVRVSDTAWEPGGIEGFQMLSRMGRIISGTGTRAAIESLQSDPAVESIEASRPSDSYDVVASLPFIRADVAQIDFSETGERALIGIIDSGIDVLHEAFRDASGTSTRILAIWDQNDSSAGVPGDAAGAANGVPTRPYGRMHTQAQIDEYIQTGTVPETLGRDVRYKHGTHVASIAAGRKGTEFAGGIAPDAKVVVVIPASKFGEDEPFSLGYSVSHIDALAFIEELATNLGLPVVVNVSQGMNAGAHDGKSSLEIAFNEFCDGGKRAGFVVVKSAGNERDQDVHATLNVVPGGQDVFQWDAVERHRGPDTLEVWFEPNDQLEFRLRHPIQGESPWVTITDRRASGDFPGGNHFEMTYVRIHQDNGDSRLLVTITPGMGLGIEQGRWSLDVRSPVVQSREGLVHAWLEKTAADVRFVIPDQEMTVTIPGTADAVITVASVHASKPFTVAPYSCFGPTRDGREKPDIAAPGHQVTAALAGTNDDVVQQSGTSMAAPHVAGGIALLLSRRAKLADSTPGLKQLNANQIAALLRVTTQEHSGSWNKGMGYGVLDIAAALQNMPVD